MTDVVIERLEKSFGANHVLKAMDLRVPSKQFVTLLGPSGCGKTTLLRCIAGLEQASGGRILFGENRVDHLPPGERNIAMVFQSYALYPTMSVRRNIGFGLEMRKVESKQREAAVNDAADLLQIRHLLDRKPGQLSGGQRQRVAMGRAIVRNPDLFLFDEPLSNLDAKLRVEMRTEIKRLHDRLKTTTVYVTHDQVEALTLGTKVAVMKGGIIQQFADPETIYERPANMFVAGFIGSPTMNFLTGTLEQSDDGFALRHGTGALSLAGVDQDLSGFVGREVVAGIRPETLGTGEGRATLSGTVDVIEPTGPDTMVIVDVGGQMLTARLGPKERPKPGAPLTLTVDSAAINLFDPASGNRI